MESELMAGPDAKWKVAVLYRRGAWGGAIRRILLILCTGVSMVVTIGCGDRLRSASTEEMLAFQGAEASGPSVDVEQIVRAKFSIGPYRVVPGDILQVEIPRVLDASLLAVGTSGEGRAVYNCRVDDGGNVLLPVVGRLSVTGKSLAEIESLLVAQYYPKYTKVLLPIYVNILQYHTYRVSIVGAVARPGIYPLRHDQMSLVALLMEAGGIADRGAAVIRLSHRDSRDRLTAERHAPAQRRGPEGWATADLGRFEASTGAGAVDRSPLVSVARAQASSVSGNRMEDRALVLPVKGLNIPFADVALEDGDSVVVEGPSEQYITVVGLVVRPGNMPCSPDARHTLIQAIAFAGGFDMIAIPRYVSVYRLKPDGDVAAVTIKLVNPKNRQHLTKDLALVLNPGDVVSVEHTPRTRANVIFDRFFRTSLGLGMYIDPQDIWGNSGHD